MEIPEDRWGNGLTEYRVEQNSVFAQGYVQEQR